MDFRLTHCRNAKAKTLNISLLNLHDLPEELKEFDWLEELDISNNLISTLDNLPPKLKKLVATSNLVYQVEQGQLPSTLLEVDLGDNRISDIENFNEGLVELDLNNNLIDTVSGYPSTLRVLDVTHNTISDLGDLPAELEILKASHNILTDVSGLVDSITHLYLHDNLISEMGELPKNLEVCILHQNKLTEFPEPPDPLLELDLSNNELTSLPSLSFNLTKLLASDNRISTVDDVPDGVEHIDLSNNDLQEKPNIPATCKIVDVSHNPFNQEEGVDGEEDDDEDIGNYMANFWNNPNSYESSSYNNHHTPAWRNKLNSYNNSNNRVNYYNRWNQFGNQNDQNQNRGWSMANGYNYSNWQKNCNLNKSFKRYDPYETDPNYIPLTTSKTI